MCSIPDGVVPNCPGLNPDYLAVWPCAGYSVSLPFPHLLNGGNVVPH